MRLPIKVQAMDGSGEKEYPPLPKSELDKLGHGSMVMVFDPETGVWYWVVIEKRLKDPQYFQGRIDAHCIIGPTLRHGGTIFFHEDNVLFVWLRKVDPIFDKAWFRVLAHIISFGAGVKALKSPEKSPSFSR